MKSLLEILPTNMIKTKTHLRMFSFSLLQFVRSKVMVVGRRCWLCNIKHGFIFLLTGGWWWKDEEKISTPGCRRYLQYYQVRRAPGSPHCSHCQAQTISSMDWLGLSWEGNQSGQIWTAVITYLDFKNPLQTCKFPFFSD